MQQDKAQNAPQRFVQEGGVYRLVDGVAGAVDAGGDDVAGHGPRQVGVVAEGLLVKEVAPATHTLADEEAQGGDVAHRQGVDLFDPAHQRTEQERHDDAAVDGKPAVPYV